MKIATLQHQVIAKFKPKFFPEGKVYLEEDLIELNVCIAKADIAPKVVIHDKKRNWLIIIEAVISHGPIDLKRRNEIKDLFSGSKIGIVYVTAFPDTETYIKYAKSIAWETEVWIASEPDHLIHYNGDRFLGPYEE